LAKKHNLMKIPNTGTYDNYLGIIGQCTWEFFVFGCVRSFWLRGVLQNELIGLLQTSREHPMLLESFC
jgi:hypothetical protein